MSQPPRSIGQRSVSYGKLLSPEKAQSRCMMPGRDQKTVPSELTTATAGSSVEPMPGPELYTITSGTQISELAPGPLSAARM